MINLVFHSLISPSTCYLSQAPVGGPLIALQEAGSRRSNAEALNWSQEATLRLCGCSDSLASVFLPICRAEELNEINLKIPGVDAIWKIQLSHRSFPRPLLSSHCCQESPWAKLKSWNRPKDETSHHACAVSRSRASPSWLQLWSISGPAEAIMMMSVTPWDRLGKPNCTSDDSTA